MITSPGSSYCYPSNGHYPGDTITTGRKIGIFYTGGYLANIQHSDVTVERLFNITNTELNITQLYSVAAAVNKTLGNGEYKGVLIVGNNNSLTGLGYFSSILFNTNKTIVISSNSTLGLPIANQSLSTNRGPILTHNDSAVYSGGLPPYKVPIGVLDTNGTAHYFYRGGLPKFFDRGSGLRLNYTNFTDPGAYNKTRTIPTIRIVNQTNVTDDFIRNVAPNLQGLVVNITGTPFTTTGLQSLRYPVMFVKDQQQLAFVSKWNVPTGIIPGGYLSPAQAQLFLYVAALNNATSPAAWSQWFGNPDII